MEVELNWKCLNSKSPVLTVDEAFDLQDKLIVRLSLLPYLYKVNEVDKDTIEKIKKDAEAGLCFYTEMEESNEIMVLKAVLSAYSPNDKCSMLGFDGNCQLKVEKRPPLSCTSKMPDFDYPNFKTFNTGGIHLSFMEGSFKGSIFNMLVQSESDAKDIFDPFFEKLVNEGVDGISISDIYDAMKETKRFKDLHIGLSPFYVFGDKNTCTKKDRSQFNNEHVKNIDDVLHFYQSQYDLIKDAIKTSDKKNAAYLKDSLKFYKKALS